MIPMAQGWLDTRTWGSWMCPVQEMLSAPSPHGTVQGVKNLFPPHNWPCLVSAPHHSDVTPVAEPSLIYGHEWRWRSSLEGWAVSEGRWFPIMSKKVLLLRLAPPIAGLASADIYNPPIAVVPVSSREP